MNLVQSATHVTLRCMIGLLLAAVVASVLTGCGEPPVQTRSVYMLIDTSGTYTKQLDKAQKIMNYLLATLDSGDSLALARIDSASFSEKDIVAKVSFDERPSTANDQKRLFQHRMNQFIEGIDHGSAYTDITGGVMQAVDYLNETGADEKYVLIFSDLEEDLPEGHVRDFPIDVSGVQVVALNVTKLSQDNIDPRDYQTRLEHWQERVLEGGGHWRVLNDLERMDRLIALK